MKISKLFHWLYCIVMLLPVMVAPIFAIYSHRHTIDSYNVQADEVLVVNFNQKKLSGGQHTYLDNGITTIIDDYTYKMSGTCDNTFIFNFGTYEITNGHKFYLRYGIKSVSNQYRIGDFNNGNSISYTENGAIYEPVTSAYLGVEILNGTTLDIEFYFNVFDLTQMFGAGNEPSIQQFDSWYDSSYYPYTLSHKELLYTGNTITYSDTDIGSQLTYQVYNVVDKYFNYDNVFNFGDLYGWLQLTFFSGNAPLGFFIFWHLLIYWLLTSLLWLLFDVLIYVPQLVHRWLDKASLS